MVTLADETTEDEAEDLIDLTAAKQKRQWTVDATSQHANHRLQHSPKVTFFDTGNNASATREEEKSDDETDMSFSDSDAPLCFLDSVVILSSFLSARSTEFVRTTQLFYLERCAKFHSNGRCFFFSPMSNSTGYGESSGQISKRAITLATTSC